MFTSRATPRNSLQSSAATPVLDQSWVALPGLFTEDDLLDLGELEHHRVALVRRGPSVLYGVYLRITECQDLPPRSSAPPTYAAR
ncbi:MAG: hypothetical protein Q8Q09_14580 [Deltaproteobacteria bacterium]|nr:hypothetical protein [Deltaproteobacteria bacterium]